MGFLFFGKKKSKKENNNVDIKENKKKNEVSKPNIPAKGKEEQKSKKDTTKTTKKSSTIEEKASVEQEKKSTRSPSSKKVYHISLRKEDGKWQVKYGGGKKAIKLFNTQAEAIKFAEERADNQDGSISIHKKNGKMRKQDYSKKSEDKESK